MMIYIEPDAIKILNLSIIFSEKLNKYILRDRSKSNCQIPIYSFDTLKDIEFFIENLKSSGEMIINEPLKINFRNKKDLFITHLENLLIEIRSKG